jgi:hypothetical protein
MKKILLIFFVIILFLVFVWQNNNNPKFLIARLIQKGDSDKSGLKYRLNFLGIIPVGEATFNFEKIEDYKGIKVYHLSATASPLKFYSALFSGYALLDSYVDIRSLNPILFRQKIEAPGKENPNKEVFYDQEKGTMSLGGVARQILPNTQDPLSAIFNLKRMDLSNIKKIEMNINTNQKNYILNGTVKQRVISIKNKEYKFALIEAGIRRRDKDPYHKSNVTIVLLEGRENIPVFIKVFASGALLTAKLIDVK